MTKQSVFCWYCDVKIWPFKLPVFFFGVLFVSVLQSLDL